MKRVYHRSDTKKKNIANFPLSQLSYNACIKLRIHMFKQIALWTIGTFIVLQAIQIDIPETPKVIDPKSEIQAPQKIQALLKTSCYDCHSYQTEIPWYGNIFPVSLEVRSHIKNGRQAVNFEIWEEYDEEKRQKIYRGIVKTINFRMPIPMYLKIHEEAMLSQKQRNEIKKWAKSYVKEEER
jgi:hypothetical protein